MGAAPHQRTARSRPSPAAPDGQTSEQETARWPPVAGRWFGLLAMGCLLVATMLAAAIVDRISQVLREPEPVVAALTSPTVINFTYDDLLPAALADQLSEVVVELESGERIRLPEHAPLVGRDLIEQVWPRELARAQIEAAVGAWGPQLASGRITSDAAVGPTRAGWSELSTAAANAFDALGLYDSVIERLLAPPIRARTNEGLGPVFGVSLSAQDSRIAARRILPPAWTSTQVAALAGAVAPYLSGAAPQFEAVIPVRSRVPAALQFLHEEITDERALQRLVHDRILSPLIAARIRQAGRLPLGIELSATEVETELLASIPSGWFAGETSLLAQVFADYLVGERDGIALEIPLAERNAAFARRLADLVHTKIRLRLADLPQCRRNQLFAAGRSLRAARLPRCAPGSVSLLTRFVTPLIEAEFDRIVDAMPTALALEHEDVVRHLGPESMASLDELRRRVHDGLVWTERDLLGFVEEHEAGPALAFLRRGAVTPRELEALVPQDDERLRQALTVGRIAVGRPWLLDLLALALAGAIAWLAQGSLRTRLQVSAYAVSVSALIVVATLVCLDLPATSDLVEIFAYDPQSWPRLSDALALGPVPGELSDLARELRHSAALAVAPWVLLGPVVHVVRRVSSRFHATGEMAGRGTQASSTEPPGDERHHRASPHR